MLSTVERILESAEAQARVGGYNSFSFRRISNDIGIKSSSIHYHFPTKADLATALAKRYRERFVKHLDFINGSKRSLQEKVDSFIDLFRQSVVADQKMCLCGIFAAEIAHLPPPVKNETRLFFEQNLSWLRSLFQQYQIDAPASLAIQLLASLEGGMLMALTFESDHYFEKAADFIDYGLLSSE